MKLVVEMGERKEIEVFRGDSYVIDEFGHLHFSGNRGDVIVSNGVGWLIK